MGLGWVRERDGSKGQECGTRKSGPDAVVGLGFSSGGDALEAGREGVTRGMWQ